MYQFASWIFIAASKQTWTLQRGAAAFVADWACCHCYCCCSWLVHFYFLFLFFAIELLQCLNTIITCTNSHFEKYWWWCSKRVPSKPAASIQISTTLPSMRPSFLLSRALDMEPLIVCMLLVRIAFLLLFFLPFFPCPQRDQAHLCFHQFYTVDLSHYGFCAEKAMYSIILYIKWSQRLQIAC